MNKGLKRVLQIGIPVVIVGAIVIPRLDFSSDKETSTPTTAVKAASRGALPVSGIVASMSTSGNGIPVTGLLVANEEVELVSETAGKVVKIAFEEGTLVKKGTLLVKVMIRICRLNSLVPNSKKNYWLPNWKDSGYY